VRVVQGGVPETTALLAQRFDCIMYTGSPAVGKVVMAAAAKHLTPVLLELGGKNPVIVDATASLPAAAQSIMRARCTNAGQICIAPEYVLVEASVEEALIAELRAATTRLYGEQPKASVSFGRIVNRTHWARIAGLIKTAGGKVLAGGDTDESQLYIAPTIIRGAAAAAPISCEEVFGPVLCVRPVKDLSEAIAVVNAGEKPLACYLFSNSSAAQARVLAETSAGGMTINDTLNHLCIPELPFGGVGTSGMGAYHGKTGFDAFTHRKAVFHTGRLNVTSLFTDPPFGERQAATLRTIMAITPYRLLPVGVKDALILGLTAAVVVLAGRVAGRW
jgi:acyl-CoA reductase-like NAD-dependent aldehyde dehydrogenase